VRVWLYKLLGAAAVILGLFNIRDFISYKPGSLGTEMPLFLRPKVKRVISSVTSPKGAFIVGLFVTLFLLPCTIGPYIITGGILCSFAMLHNILPLLFYNLIFVSPMLLVVFIVYQGFKNVDDINKWKEKHITHLHLAAGIIMVLLGIAMVLGLV
jgi:cytochrome c biogenesis protein CcdA